MVLSSPWINMSGETDKKAPSKPKVDLAYLLEKYGPKKKKVTKQVEEEPKYEEKGFSVQFKLSHAFKALEQQEQDVAQPEIEPKAKLSARALKRLTSANKNNNIVYPKAQNIIKNPPEDRVSTDIEKFRKIGQMKKEKSNTTLKIARQEQQEQYLGSGELKINKKQRIIPLEFWRSLSKRKGKERDQILEDDMEYDKTFLTNANPDIFLSTPKSKNQRKVRISNHVSYSNDQQTNISQSPKSNRKNPPVFYGSKAVHEWEKRKRNRKQRKNDQKNKIKQAQNINITQVNQTESQTIETPRQVNKPAKDVSKTEGGQMSSRKPSSKRRRPKSAPSSRRSNDPPLYKTILPGRDYVHLSEYTKALDTTFLHVPANFEEPSFNVKPVQPAKSDSNEENDVEKEAEEPELLYKPSKYVYDMCQCQKVSKLNTLKKLKETNKSAGVIEIYGCGDTTGKVSCPFCSVFPHKRILAWIEDVEVQML